MLLNVLPKKIHPRADFVRFKFAMFNPVIYGRFAHLKDGADLGHLEKGLVGKSGGLGTY